MNTLVAAEILLVDDSAEDTEMTVRTLRRGRVNNPVFPVRDGADALDFIFAEGQFSHRQGQLPSLIMLDLKMPHVGGIEVIQRLKASPSTASIPIIVLTTSVAHRDLIQSYNLGANSYLIKPVSFAAFAEVVAQVGMSWTITDAIQV